MHNHVPIKKYNKNDFMVSQIWLFSALLIVRCVLALQGRGGLWKPPPSDASPLRIITVTIQLYRLNRDLPHQLQVSNQRLVLGPQHSETQGRGH